MDDAELAVWSVMLGGLLTLAAVAFAFTLLVRSANALRYLSFVTLTGLGSLMRTGLVEVLLPEIPMGVLHLVKVCAGPLSAALVIRYMSIWLGAPQADPGIHRLASWGTGAMLLAALVLAVLVFVVPDELFWRLLRASAIITAVAAAIGLAAALRAGGRLPDGGAVRHVCAQSAPARPRPGYLDPDGGLHADVFPGGVGGGHHAHPRRTAAGPAGAAAGGRRSGHRPAHGLPAAGRRGACLLARAALPQ
jgi:hypothetical protein